MTVCRWMSTRPPFRSSASARSRRTPSLTQETRAVATIVPDESRISHVHARVAGWIEQLDVNTTGELVTAGQPLGRIFSQELLVTDRVSGRATEHRRVRYLERGDRQWANAPHRVGMAPDEIDAIEQSGEPRRLVTVVAPRSGVVVNRGVTAGTSVDPSTTLLTIADLSRVWVLAEVPEANIPGIRVGTLAHLDFPASGRQPFAACRLRLSDAHRPHAHAARPLLGGQSGRQPQTGPVWNGGL